MIKIPSMKVVKKKNTKYEWIEFKENKKYIEGLKLMSEQIL